MYVCMYVFDCAAKYKDQSLNMQLLQSPDLTNNLVGVLIRFQEGSIALAADIESMFYQVFVDPDDCNIFRFLWWENTPSVRISASRKQLRSLEESLTKKCRRRSIQTCMSMT